MIRKRWSEKYCRRWSGLKTSFVWDIPVHIHDSFLYFDFSHTSRISLPNSAGNNMKAWHELISRLSSLFSLDPPSFLSLVWFHHFLITQSSPAFFAFFSLNGFLSSLSSDTSLLWLFDKSYSSSSSHSFFIVSFIGT